ncbi:hypothetical protein Q9Q94_06555 [Uliginosibacterium sp. 31-16]|uniref:hypothetical protein n=1 Tax=Uliginosibacterium sp. 31-16 TaxID=3068315 RepID=UPI00273DF72B|nr:hypothetical protein [Uliginosibacterium sp. 31-16]MDP5239181.1 hypothetical protein [Uliginosibacterium sp. 31-16]
MRKPEIKVADLIAEALYQPEPPALPGDVGDDSVFATETHPEGLRYGEQPHPPGTVQHGAILKKSGSGNGDISIG